METFILLSSPFIGLVAFAYLCNFAQSKLENTK